MLEVAAAKPAAKLIECESRRARAGLLETLDERRKMLSDDLQGIAGLGLPRQTTVGMRGTHGRPSCQWRSSNKT